MMSFQVFRDQIFEVILNSIYVLHVCIRKLSGIQYEKCYNKILTPLHTKSKNNYIYLQLKSPLEVDTLKNRKRKCVQVNSA